MTWTARALMSHSDTMPQAIPPPYQLRAIAAQAMTSERTVRRWYLGLPQLSTTAIRLETAARQVGAPLPGGADDVVVYVTAHPGETSVAIADALKHPLRSVVARLREARLRFRVCRVGDAWFPSTGAGDVAT